MLSAYFRELAVPTVDSFPWAPLARTRPHARIAVVIINVRGLELPFDYEREGRERLSGDPTYRVLPHDLKQLARARSPR